MPDQDPVSPSDPIDDAVARAEAMLDEPAARAARRARVLAAIAAADDTRTAKVAPPAASRRSGRPLGGWLAAASVAGLSLLLAMQLYRPAPRAESPPRPATRPAAVGPQALSRPPPATAPSSRTIAEVERTPVSPQPPPPLPPVAPPPAAIAAPAPAPAPAPPPPPPPPPPAPAPVAPALVPVPSADISAPARRRAAVVADRAPPALSSDLAATLRAAAADGRVREVERLLTQGAPVDAADDDGETALIACVRADRPAVAAVLRRHGASLDARTRTGDSVRAIAKEINDPALDRALGLDP